MTSNMFKNITTGTELTSRNIKDLSLSPGIQQFWDTNPGN
jgi:hypothetical protein